METEELNELTKQIEIAYRNDNKKWNIRLTQIHPEHIREIMLKYKIGLLCSKCLKKKHYERYCCTEHSKYYREITSSFYGKNYPITIMAHTPCKEVECASCKEKQDWHELSIDHITPITKGGLEFDRQNLQFMHLSCNIRKYNHTEEELLEKRKTISKQHHL